MVKELDIAMQHLSDVIFHTTGKDVSLHPGAGAAGGMGGSLHAFLDAQLKPGIELFLETLDFAEKIKDADLIITGEGKSDRQTLMGKVPSGILQEARRQHIPVILLAGAIEDAGILNAAGFRGVFSITQMCIRDSHRTWRERHERCRSGNAASIGIPFLR